MASIPEQSEGAAAALAAGFCVPITTAARAAGDGCGINWAPRLSGSQARRRGRRYGLGALRYCVSLSIALRLRRL
jgi:hypothetical protein